ncbi:uncharacterized protein [Lepisosteus oculatus]|uniref:uncharacterized protein isoform X1 n=2 Tax=Lepisosteus oculatus TaxID=7918 RepID=UPI00371DFE5D
MAVTSNDTQEHSDSEKTNKSSHKRGSDDEETCGATSSCEPFREDGGVMEIGVRAEIPAGARGTGAGNLEVLKMPTQDLGMEHDSILKRSSAIPDFFSDDGDLNTTGMTEQDTVPERMQVFQDSGLEDTVVKDSKSPNSSFGTLGSVPTLPFPAGSQDIMEFQGPVQELLASDTDKQESAEEEHDQRSPDPDKPKLLPNPDRFLEARVEAPKEAKPERPGKKSGGKEKSEKARRKKGKRGQSENSSQLWEKMAQYLVSVLLPISLKIVKTCWKGSTSKSRGKVLKRPGRPQTGKVRCLITCIFLLSLLRTACCGVLACPGDVVKLHFNLTGNLKGHVSLINSTSNIYFYYTQHQPNTCRPEVLEKFEPCLSKDGETLYLTRIASKSTAIKYTLEYETDEGASVTMSLSLSLKNCSDDKHPTPTPPTSTPSPLKTDWAATPVFITVAFVFLGSLIVGLILRHRCKKKKMSGGCNTVLCYSHNSASQEETTQDGQAMNRMLN